MAPASLDPFPAEGISQFLRAFLYQMVEVGVDRANILEGLLQAACRQPGN